MAEWDDFDPEEEGELYQLFEVLRQSFPVPSADFSRRVGERISQLPDDARLRGPEPERVLGDLFGEVIEVITHLIRPDPDVRRDDPTDDAPPTDDNDHDEDDPTA